MLNDSGSVNWAKNYNNKFAARLNFSALSILCLLTIWQGPLHAHETVVRVGIYQNPPKIFSNSEDQKPQGIFGDLLRQIASEQHWRLQPVNCNWQQCLKLLEDGKIDLMPDVAYNDERMQRFDFHKTPVLISWSQVYALPNQKLNSILDLDKKHIAVLADSVQESHLQQLTESFHINPVWHAVQSVEEGMHLISEKQVDAIATNNFFGDREGVLQLGLIATPILYQPSQLFFATTHGKHSDLLATIDETLNRWKQDQLSIYYETIRHWNARPTREVVPRSIWIALAALVTSLSIILIFTYLLRRQVEHKTSQLQESEQYLNTILNNVDAYIYIKDRKRRYQYVNQKFCEALELNENHVIGKTDDAFFTEESCIGFMPNDLSVLREGNQVAQEEIYQFKNKETRLIFFSIKLPLRKPDGEIYALCGISTNITEHYQTQEQIHQLSFYDHLTGLPNRNSILNVVSRALLRFQKTLFDGAFLLFELENFKKINASMGHEFGDQVLLAMANRLQENLKSKYTAGRLEGDQFVIVLEELDSDTEHAVKVALEYAQLTLLNLTRPDTALPSHISVYVGIAMFSDVKPQTTSLLTAASLALHKAKSSEDERICFFNPAMQIEVNQRLSIEHKLRLAIDNNQLRLHLQPQVGLTKNIVGMEALVRWHDEELGWISPGLFIPIAEESELINCLGSWVLDRACYYLSRWQQDQQTASITIAVNISARQFKHHDFLKQVKNYIAKHAINPCLLEFEITESLLIDDLEHTIMLMGELKKLGIQFSLDDFGTGYASLGYLKRLPLSQLKIDQGFVRDILNDANDEAIIQTILLLGQSLHLEVIAEGVETTQQAERLTQMGCGWFQGYLFGKPQTYEYWTEYLQRLN